MPWREVDVDDMIAKRMERDPEFKKLWEEQENEREILRNVTRLRNQLQFTQKRLAELSGSTQQEISRLEKQEHSPTLATICRIINSMGYELKLEKRKSV
jgi:Predicted transcriptional regulator with C-terminal CBS domains